MNKFQSKTDLFSCVQECRSNRSIESAISKLESELRNNSFDVEIASLLGQLYTEEKRFSEAVKIYSRSELQENYAAQINLGICKIELGEWNDGIRILEAQKKIKRYDFFLYLKLVEAYIASAQHLNARSTLEQMEQREFGENLAVVSAYCLILDWIEGNFSELEKQLKNIAALDNVKYPNLAAYGNFIARLALYWGRTRKKPFIAAEKFYVIGDSHSLSFKNALLENFYGTYLPEIQWIMGAKAYHFCGSKNNLMKSKALLFRERIPQKSKILFLFGEIDLRETEGVIPRALKTSENIVEIIQKTINGYLEFITKTFEPSRYEIYIGTVHAPLFIDKTNIENQQYRGDVIQKWNTYLLRRIREEKLRPFDVYSYTVGKDKFGKKEIFIDSNHLKPIAYTEVFKRATFLNGEINVKINIDGREIDYDSLDSDLQDLVNSYRLADQEISRLNALLAITNAAKAHYISIVKERLAMRGL